MGEIEVKKSTVKDILRSIDEGRYAIPKLQREFVWNGTKAAKLFDSMYRHMPIGVVMIWETSKNQRLYLRQNYHVLPPFNPRNSKVWFLMDGQQRISVIHHARKGDKIENSARDEIDFSRVVLSMEKEDDGHQIRYRKAINGCFESLCDVLHPQWRSRLSHLSMRQLKKIKKCRDQITRYPIFQMYIKAGIEDVRESFLRINTLGMKITSADAIFTRAEGLDLRDFCHEVRQHVNEWFGVIPEMPILFAMAALHGASEARGEALEHVIHRLEKKVRVDQAQRKSLASGWHKLGACFGKAIDYLRVNFSVLNRQYLYSDYMVAMLALFLYWNGRGPSHQQKEQIRKWFWATNIGSRYSGQNFNRCIPEDIKLFKRLAKNPRTKFTYKPQADYHDVKKDKYTNRTGITCAAYCMLLMRKPVQLKDDGLNEIPIDNFASDTNQKNRHHIFPKATLSWESVPAKIYNSIANICLLTLSENLEIGSKRSHVYLGEIRDTTSFFKRKMDRHLIPVDEDSGIWMRNVKKGFFRFLESRTKMICQALEKEAGIKLFRRDV